MSEHNGYGSSQLVANQINAQFGMSDPFNSLWRSLSGSLGGLGAAAYYGPDSGGWRNYDGNSYAIRDVLCIFKDKMGVEWVGYSRDFHPEFNIADLKWKYTGVAKEQGYGY